MTKNRIRDLRKEKNETIEDIAELLGVSRATINNYERGTHEPKLATWKKLADYFNVPVGYIQGVEPYRTRNEAKYAFNKAIEDDSDAFVHRKYSVLDPFLATHGDKYDELFLSVQNILKFSEDEFDKLDLIQKRRLAWVIESLLDTPSQILESNNYIDGEENRFIDVMVTASNDWFEPEQPANADNVTEYQYNLRDGV